MGASFTHVVGPSEEGEVQPDIEFVLRNSSIFRDFLLPCMWLFSFSSQFSSACTVKMQTKTGLK